MLKKTEGWLLDNRGSFLPQDIEVRIGWVDTMTSSSVDSARPGSLVWEHDQVMVIETNFTIEQGELIRIERMAGASVQTVCGTLIESRPGKRVNDVEKGIHLHWVNMR
ncbi:hypothetical protein HDE76_003046 [Rhodanobacter sp. ANJX3]|uniref:hypothetical protein n=1 Tax=Rhodanobacter sp. ANJX3 TaxID=2723083 RepID=UPI001856A1FE|nr:hypothetical protein [Rhodanobacter sp. ANJX3]MBB5359806.1 hypothetical protein [Rhodanobacter sp. ANJX3]